MHQDVTDLARHFSRRESLYRHLGIPGALLHGSSVIEFGPGPGFNALYTASLEPSEYVLVDGNPRSLKSLKENFSKFQIDPSYKICSSLIEEFPVERQFDLVLCEGVIPFQLDPKAFVQHLGRFVRPGGLLVITCIDSVSFLGESVRRLLSMKLSPFQDSPEQRIAALEPFFKPHLSTLTAMSRPVRDWLEDNIIIKYYGRFFSMADAIDALDSEFEVYQSSPQFFADMRWYKGLYGEHRKFNELARAQYLTNIGNLIDYRVSVPPMSADIGAKLLEHGEMIFDVMLELEEKGTTPELCKKASQLLLDTARLASHISAETSKSLEEAAAFMLLERADASYPLPSFSSFFGRGQQYLSFIKKRLF